MVDITSHATIEQGKTALERPSHEDIAGPGSPDLAI